VLLNVVSEPGLMDWVLSIGNNLPLCTENIELHAPTSSTQKLKLIGRGGQFIYIPKKTSRNSADSQFFIC